MVRAFGFRQACDTIGSVLGPLLVYFLAGWSPHQLFLVALIPGLLAFILIYFFVSDVPHKAMEPGRPFSLLFIFKNSLPNAFYSLLAAFALFGLGSFNKSLLVLRMQDVLSPSLRLPPHSVPLPFYIYFAILPKHFQVMLWEHSVTKLDGSFPSL